MAGLTLTFKPGERFLVGGHLLENGPRRSSMRIVDDGVFVLRLSDALHPDEVTTPVRRAYHAAQLILACEVELDEGRAALLEQLEALSGVFIDTPHADVIDRAIEAAEAGRFHAVLVGLKSLMPIEAEMLGLTNHAETDASDEDTQRVISGRR